MPLAIAILLTHSSSDFRSLSDRFSSQFGAIVALILLVVISLELLVATMFFQSGSSAG
jgi:hypothetical protein